MFNFNNNKKENKNSVFIFSIWQSRNKSGEHFFNLLYIRFLSLLQKKFGKNKYASLHFGNNLYVANFTVIQKKLFWIWSDK